jgi:ABC-type bacteriocin/lantibiotic exporter with double-glycine peptidase domain
MIRAAAVGLLIVACAAPPSWGDDHGADSDRRINDCGVNGLYALLRLCGRHADLAAVRAALPEPGDKGLSMAQLAAAADRLGQPVRGVRLRPEDFPLDRPAIVLLRTGEDSGHFVVVRPVGRTGTLVTLLDFPRPPRLVDVARLRSGAGWTGLALVPALPHERAAPYVAGAAALGLAAVGLTGARRRRPADIRPDAPRS